ncbi:hypothetical protein [Oceanicola granulosus]|nr:hypothetical protein [Oceanicola granulosus]
MPETTDLTAVCRFVLAERARCLSEREWKHRLAGYGYGIRDAREGRVLTSLARGRDLCPLEA